MGRKRTLTTYLFIAVLVLGCKGDGSTHINPSVTVKFEAYLEEAFDENIREEEHFYLFTTEKVCALCVGNHFSSFKEFQNELNKRNLTVISDFPCAKRLDSSLIEVCRYDSLGLFNNYSFPKSYLTFYRTKSKMVQSYAFYKQSSKFMEFVEEHDRLLK